MNKLTEADAEATETQVWPDFSKDFGYLATESHAELIAGYEELGRRIQTMLAKAHTFRPRE